MRRQLASIALASASFFFLTGFGEKHSSVEAQSSAKDKGVELQFKVKPDAGMQISKEAPWTLQLVNTQGLKLETKEGKFETKTFDEALPGFTVKADAEGASGKVDYVIKAFVCTTDKKHCYPQMHKGSLEWKKG
jgi:hypothetical protein